MTPLVSTAKLAPAPVIRPISSRASVVEASIVCVAPSSRASSSRAGRTSIPMMGEQPVIAPAMIAERPTAPVPKTASELPAGGRSELKTAPAPVWMPHPNGAAMSNGIQSGSLTTLRAVATACVAKLDCPKKWLWTGPASRESTLVPSGRAAAKLRPKKSWQ